MDASTAIAVLSIIGFSAGPALAKPLEHLTRSAALTESSVARSHPARLTVFEAESFEVIDDDCDGESSLTTIEARRTTESFDESCGPESGLVSDTLSAGDPGLEHTAADSCAEASFLELFLEHEVSLQYYSTETGGPTSHFFDLVFHLCRRVDDPALTQFERQQIDTRFRAGIDHFIDVLQHHFETRGQSYFSALTQCFDENGFTYRAPNAAGEVPPYDSSIPYLPIIGYQLLFGKDPLISIELRSDLDSVGKATAWPMPNDSFPEPGRNYIFINPDRANSERTIAGVIAHEMAHQTGYGHDDPTNPSTDTSMTYAIGNCVGDYTFEE